MFVTVVAACAGRGAETAKTVERKGPGGPRENGDGLRVVAEGTSSALLAEEDCDGDARITILDRAAATSAGATAGARRDCRADGRFRLRFASGPPLDVVGTDRLSNLLGELELARRVGQRGIFVERVLEDPVTRISRSIRERYWDGLTRRLDPEHLVSVLHDTKVAGGASYLYVPYDDEAAYEWFSAWVAHEPETGVRVLRLPEHPTAQWVQGLSERHGLLSLATVQQGGTRHGVPYVVPGGRFNELYGWDSYFHVLGLVADGRVELARSIVDNFVYEIEHYGKILNANRTYYLTRSQPPFLASMIAEVLRGGGVGAEQRAEWTSRAVAAAMREYATVWLGPERTTPSCDPAAESGAPWSRVCLSRYGGNGLGEPPEVEPGHFHWVYEKYAQAAGVGASQYRDDYLSGRRVVPELDEFFRHDRCMRESGHDTTYRWFDSSVGEGRCAHFATVDLNVLLHRFEVELAQLVAGPVSVDVSKEALSAAGLPPTAASKGFWCERARSRARAIRQHLLDPRTGLFFDYDFARSRRNEYLSATTLYPLWSPGTACGAPLVDRSEARRLVDAALERLEAPGGIAATARDSAAPFSALPARQWEYPNGWAPHQILAWQGLHEWGFEAERHRLAYSWLWMITRNAADFAGTVPEKFDVVARSHRVFAEYGNVGTDFRYITDEGFGWMNASYQVGLALLDESERGRLRRLEPWCPLGTSCP